jgi:predicted metalloprotease with PDZ domain
MKKIFILVCLICSVCTGFSQQSYHYKVDLTAAVGNSLEVTLLPPKIEKSEVSFFFPSILPGTYMFLDFGRFIKNLKAFDKAGNELPVAHELFTNVWKIKGATKLASITYKVEDTWHQKFDAGVLPMSGTSIDPGKNYVINAPGFFGYFEQMEKLPFEVQFTKPQGFYGSSSLSAITSNDTKDVFRVKDVHELYDSPIMYCAPDTVGVSLGHSRILVSVYDPAHNLNAKMLANEMQRLLTAVQSYLGGKLPVKKYAFIFNFANNSTAGAGALEHNSSSFYALPPMKESKIKSDLVSMCTHEFLHIITPLTISSKEIREFNYQKPVLSKHLWLYEGTTEYDAHHLLLKAGLTDTKQFFQVMVDKMKMAGMFSDTLAFTKMSKEVATTYKKEYGNVYMKGALIGSCLDIYLLELSNGNYGLNNLKHDLGIKFGKDKYFDDDRLFDEMAALSFPEVKDFMDRYVGGSMSLPYVEFFARAGVKFEPHVKKEVFSIGGVGIAVMAGNRAKVVGTTQLDEVGKKMGYKLMDEIVGVNGIPVKGKNCAEIVDQVRSTLKEGDLLTITVKRFNDAGVEEEKILSAPVSIKEELFLTNYMSLMEDKDMTPLQKAVRKAWLTNGYN